MTTETFVAEVLKMMKEERIKWGHGITALVLADMEVRIADLAEKAGVK